MVNELDKIRVVPINIRSGATVNKNFWCTFVSHSFLMMDLLDNLCDNAKANDQDGLLAVCDDLQMIVSDSCIRNFVMARALESEYVRERLQYYLDNVEDLAEMVQSIVEIYVPLSSEDTDTLLNVASKVQQELVFILGVGFDLLLPVTDTIEVNEIVLRVCHNSLEELQRIYSRYMGLWAKYRPHFPSLELSDEQLDLLYEALGSAAYEVVDNIDDLTVEMAELLIAGEITAEQLLERRE